MLVRLFLLALLLGLATLSGCNSAICDRDGDGYCAPDDCDDSDPTIHPGQRDICDGIDGNCNGSLSDDESTDADGDGFTRCDDCDDSRFTVAPGADEICDGLDNDCDGDIPEGEHGDADNDGDTICFDCDDEDPTRNTLAEEVCDGVDNNCDGAYFFDPDLGQGELTDDDGDGYAPCMGDCDDGDINAHPGNYEYLTDGVDNDCDGFGDNKPLLSPELDTPENLRLLLDQECEAHGRQSIIVDFDDGVPGNPIGLTSVEGALVLRGGVDGSIPYRFADASTAPGPFEGTGYATPDAASDGVQILFDTPQTLVLWSLIGVDPNLGGQYAAEIHWDGVELGGISSIFGTTNPDWTWNERGLHSFQNVAFDSIVLHTPGAGGESVSFDNVGFCL